MNTEYPTSVRIGYAFVMLIAGLIGVLPFVLLASLVARLVPAYHDYLVQMYNIAYIPFGIAGLAMGFLTDLD